MVDTKLRHHMVRYNGRNPLRLVLIPDTCPERGRCVSFNPVEPTREVCRVLHVQRVAYFLYAEVRVQEQALGLEQQPALDHAARRSVQSLFHLCVQVVGGDRQLRSVFADLAFVQKAAFHQVHEAIHNVRGVCIREASFAFRFGPMRTLDAQNTKDAFHHIVNGAAAPLQFPSTGPVRCSRPVVPL